MTKINKKSAFTLVELTIAMALFAMMSVMATQVYSNIIRLSKKVEIHEYVFTEANAVMAKILQEVERGTIDYEEYYNHLVIGEADYGQNYGAYGSTFYDPGAGGPLPFNSPVGYSAGDGICCDSGCPAEYFFDETCPSFDVASYDVNMGSHPHNGVDPERYNALCTNLPTCDDVNYAFQDELYLIDSSASRKVIFVHEEKDNGEFFLSMVEMNSIDADRDGITDFWDCPAEYSCSGAGAHGEITPLPGDIADGAEATYATEFLPISPENLDIIDVSFFIAPFEDPFRAFAEADGAVQQHPHVIVTMTVGPSEDLSLGYLGADWTLTLQGTASTGVFDVVPSEYRGGDLRW